jgi:hypothetical protein
MANGQADGQVVFEVVAETSKIKTAINHVTKTFRSEGAQWDKETKTSTDAVTKNFDSMSKNTTSKITDLTKSMINLATKGINKMMDYSDAVDKGSKRIGISAKAYQELDYAMSMSGADIDTLSRGMNNLTHALDGSASKEIKDTLSSIGIGDAELASMQSAEELLDEVLYRIASVDDAAKQSNLANDIFGIGAGSQLAAFFAEGETGIKALRQQAEDLGIVQDDEAIAQAVKTKDSIDTLNKTLDAVLMQAITPLLPLIQSLVDFATPFLPLVTEIFSALSDLLTPILKLAGIDPEKKELQARIEADRKATAEKALGKTEWLDYVLDIYKGKNDLEAVQAIQSRGYGLYSAQYTTALKYLTGSGFTEKQAEKMAKDAFQLAYHTVWEANGTVNQRKLTYAGGDEDWYNSIGAKYADSVDAVNEKNAQLASSLDSVSTAANNAAAAMNSVNPVGVTISGSQANGLDFVSHDGLYMLHQGERVQTAAEADLYRRYGNQAPGPDIGGAIQAGMGNMQIIWRGRVVADVLSEQQGNSYRALERSGWKS